MNFRGWKKIFRKKLIASFGIGLTILPLTFVSCEWIQSKESVEEAERVDHKIRYVSIGDETSSGLFISSLGAFAGGFDKNTGRVSGASWPAFFANYIREIEPTVLESFDNLALIGASVGDWLKTFSSPKFLLGQGEAKDMKNFSKRLQLFNGEVTLKREFEGCNLRGGFCYDSLEALKKANLITISLGFHDVIAPFVKTFLDLKDFVGDFLDSNLKARDKLVFRWPQMVKSLVEAGEKLVVDLQNFLRVIRALNPNAEIVLVGYSFNSLFLFTSIVDEIIKRFTAEWRGEIVDTIYRIINDSLAKVAKEEKLNFVNTLFEELWSKNIDASTSAEPDKIFYLDYLVDLLPSLKGNKWIAQQLFLKLTLPESLENFTLSQNTETPQDFEYRNWLGLGGVSFGFVKDYLAQDNRLFRRTLNFSPKRAKLIPKILVEDFKRENLLEFETKLPPKAYPFLIPSKFVGVLNPNVAEIVINALKVFYSLESPEQNLDKLLRNYFNTLDFGLSALKYTTS